MTKSVNNFSRVLRLLLFCTGLVFAGCTEDSIDDNINNDSNVSIHELHIVAGSDARYFCIKKEIL